MTQSGEADKGRRRGRWDTRHYQNFVSQRNNHSNCVMFVQGLYFASQSMNVQS
jgi:hypothetical protein